MSTSNSPKLQQTLLSPALADAVPLPIGFPTPPAHLSIAQERFQVWACGWRKYNGERTASVILTERLVEFIRASSTLVSSEKIYCKSETWLDSAKAWLDSAKTRLNADTKHLNDTSEFVNLLTTTNSSLPACAQRLLDAATSSFIYANDHMEWVHKNIENAHKNIENARNTVKDDKAKLDTAAKAVDELVFPAYTGNTEPKSHNKSLKPITQVLKRARDNNGDDVKIVKRPRTRQQDIMIHKSNILANTLTDWQQISSKIVFGKILGRGRSGVVYSAIINGRTVAVKVSNADASATILNELCNEVNVYKHLAELQGDVIPRLYGHGILEVDGTLRAALILEKICDCVSSNSEDNLAEQLSLSVRQSAMNALDKIHACGVIHGDPRMNNVLFERNDMSHLPLKARFVDLAFGKIGIREWLLEEDYENWGRVLDLPGF